MTDDITRLLALCAIRVDGKSPDWSLIARAAQAGHLDNLAHGDVPPDEASTHRYGTAALLRTGLRDLHSALAKVQEERAAADAIGARLITVLDDHYPENLRRVHDLPPFLFVLGELAPEDVRAVAVVGTRQASVEGLKRATRMAAQLVDQGVTVTSGLAKGVDTAAHESALNSGGRTIAVIGTGITRCYPAENADLARRITASGAVISQFWPTRSPGRDTFPRRNRVTSGISRGTVVIEASKTSGAKLQARLAYEHGKRVWLLRSLVTSQEWARKMVLEGKAVEVASTDDVTRDLAAPSPLAVEEAQPALDLA